MFRIFDRYLLKNFLVPFSYALFGMVAIWLIYDLGENTATFQDAHLSAGTIALFYLAQLPFILVNWTPLAVLLGLLYVLTRMSRRNEIVSMLGAGRSVVRVLLPVLVLGLALTGACTFLNFELAPKGEYAATYMIDEVSRGRSKTTNLDGHIFINRRDHRTWFIQHLRTKTEEMQGLQVIQEDAAGTILYTVYAASAVHDRTHGLWTLLRGKITFVNAAGDVVKEEYFDKKDVAGWSETPWQLGSSALKGKFMTVPQLEHYLRVNADFPPANLAEHRTQFWYRYALPWNVLVVILVAGPMCVVFSRRGALGGVAGGLFLFIGLYTSSNIFLALGQGARIPPLVAAWTPAVGFLLIGCYLLYLRTSNRPLPFLG
ncbi:MAG: LptF/LptG family permease [Verrucomicrobia bacterium]|nr:LptF/LptG family permease [Verrucomicrobiota bacterium]